MCGESMLEEDDEDGAALKRQRGPVGGLWLS